MKSKVSLLLFMSFSIMNNDHIQLTKESKPTRQIASVKTVNKRVTKSAKVIKEKKQNKALAINSLEKSISIYKKMAQYPDSSYPVDAKNTEDHLIERFKKDTRQVSYKQGQIKAWSEKNYYTQKDKTINLFIEFQDINEKLTIDANLQTNEGHKKLEYKKITKTTYKASISTKDLNDDEYLNQIKIFNSQNEEILSTVNVFTLGEEYYHFIGAADNDINSRGHLDIELDFDIYEKGTYVMEGTLYYEDEIIAVSELPLELEAGIQKINMEFFGKIFHSKKINGALELRNVSLSFVKKSLASINTELIELNYKTQDYNYTQFSEQSYNNRDILNKLSSFD